MFEVGEYVVYGNNGVCIVDEITHMEMKGVDNHKLYYRLKPVDNSGSKIFTPVDNAKVVIRKMITKKEAEDLISALPEMEPIWVPNDKQREEIYKEVMHSCDPSEWFRIILTLYNRKLERIAQGRKITSMDERYFRQVENCLYGELSVALGCNRDEVIDIIKKRVGE